MATVITAWVCVRTSDRRCNVHGARPLTATEDGVGLHYIGTELHEAVAMRDGARAWWVEPSPDGGYRDEPIPPRRL